MFSIAFLIGLYANCIYFLGIAHLFTQPVIVVFTFAYVFLSILFWSKFDQKINWEGIRQESKDQIKRNTLWVLGIISSISIMLLGALVPETAFDALWYHLTFPKLYLSNGGIDFIPGNLFYYSALPKVGEMLYVTTLSLSGDILSHLIHMFFAILTGIAIYEITKKITSQYIALIAVVIFFSNIVVLWEATTAYVDFIRAFYEVMA